MVSRTAGIRRFVADRTVGRLARWLRLLGQDVAYDPAQVLGAVLSLARTEGRLVLTRDRGICTRAAPSEYLLIASDHFREQLRQVIRTCHLDPIENAFTRCVECNTPLQSLPKEAARGKVPPYVFSTHERFSSCPTCRRIYWQATHRERALEELKALTRQGGTGDAGDAGDL